MSEQATTCDILPPGRAPFHYDRPGAMPTPCDLPRGHGDEHHSIAGGVHYSWQSDDDCECCDVTDTDRCFSYRESDHAS